MYFLNPSQKLLFITILSLFAFNSLPFRHITSASPFHSDDSSDSDSVPEEDDSMKDHVSLPHESSTAFPPSNAYPPSNQNILSQSDEEPSNEEKSDDDDDDSFSKTDLDKVTTLFSDPNTNFDSTHLGNVDPKIMTICQSTDYPNLCLSTIVPFLNGKTDKLSALEIAMKISKHIAKVALVMGKRIVDSPLTPEPIATRLAPCLDSYDDALYNFENAIDALHSKDIGTMNTMLSAVLSDVGDCKDELAGSTFPSPMKRFSERLTNMTSNCLAMITLLP